MAKINGKRTGVVISGMIIAILFWVFCITFTVSVITGQNKQIAENNATRETVIIYVEPEGENNQNNGGDGSNGNNGGEENTSPSQKETVNMEKYYMIDSAGNYVIGTGAYVDK